MPRGIVLCLFLAGCSCPPPTVVETERYVPIPPGLLAPCVAPETVPRTNGGLLEAYQAHRQALAECNGKLEALRQWGN